MSLINIRMTLLQLWAGAEGGGRGAGINLPTSQIPLDFVWQGLCPKEENMASIRA